VGVGVGVGVAVGVGLDVIACTLNVATTALQLVAALSVNVPAYDPLTATGMVSLAARDVFVSCCCRTYPLPGVTVPP
jgi:hypothetical protein